MAHAAEMLQEATCKSWARRTALLAWSALRILKQFFQFVVVLFIIFLLFSALKELWKSVKISPS